MKKMKITLQAFIFSSLIFLTVFDCLAQNFSPLQKFPVGDRSVIHENDVKSQILYDQTGLPSGQGGLISQFFLDYPLYTCQAADDFWVSENAWLVESVQAHGFYSITPPGGPAFKANLFVYTDVSGSPGSEIAAFLQVPVLNGQGGNLMINFPAPVELQQGHYWLSVQPVMAYSSTGMWYWAKQEAPTINQEFHWRNPGGGFGLPGTNQWKQGSAIWGNQGYTDWNLAFTLFGTMMELPPVLTSLSTFHPYPGQNVRIHGQNFGEYSSGCSIMINGIPYHENITWWSVNEVFFNYPDVQPVSQIYLIRANGAVSNTVDVVSYIPDKCYFLTPAENEELSESEVFISASAEILNHLIISTKFYYQPNGGTNWILIGEDVDGTAKSFGTTSPVGTGDGWSFHWDVTDIEYLQLTLKAEMTDIFGHTLTGERPVVIDKTPLAPFVNPANSKFFGGLAIDNDSLRFDVEIKDGSTELIEFKWAPPPAPIGGWDYEREVDPINQTEVVFVDANGNDVSDGACGPSAMASCLKWLAQQYPGSTTSSTSVEELAQNLAREAGTTTTGTRDDNLASAAERQLENDPGIQDDFDVKRHFNKPSGKNGPSHNVYNDIAGGLRDSADVVMLIYQVDANGDTIGHYVTASSHHNEITYYSGDFGCAAIQTSFVDFMDPATGEKVVKTITWYDNPPKIQDYDLKPGAPGEAWVHEVITIKPKKENKNPGKNGLIASFPVNGPGTYQFSLPCNSLPQGVQMIGALGVNAAGERRGNYYACANGQYDVVAGFTADHTIWIPGFPVHFNNISNPSGHITEYWWDFGDGNQSTEENPTHVYQTTGIFNLKLAVSDGTKSDTLVRENFIQIIPATEQEILLFEGWNGISGYVLPADSLLENLMAPFIENLVIVKNFNGVYWPEENVNTLGYWNEGSGYYFKLTSDEILILKGMTYVDKNLKLNSGWGFLPVLSSCTIPVTEISNQLSSNLTLIKEISGNRVYWPAVGVTTLSALEPGKAYLIHLTGTATVDFPECEKQSQVLPVTTIIQNENRWNKVVETPFNHLICLENQGEFSTINAKTLAIFNQQGNCCGFTDFSENGGNIVVSAFGDDPTTTAIDGLIEGETMSFRLYSTDGKTFAADPVSFDEKLPDRDTFIINGLSKIQGFKTALVAQTLNFDDEISIYPNPAEDYFIIDGIDGEAILEISNIDGKSILKLVISSKTRIDVGEFTQGLNFIRVTSNSKTFSGKIMIR